MSACSQQDSAIRSDPLFAGIWAQEEAIEKCMQKRGFECVAFFDPAEDPAVVAAYPELADRPPPMRSAARAAGGGSRFRYWSRMWSSLRRRRVDP